MYAPVPVPQSGITSANHRFHLALQGPKTWSIAIHPPVPKGLGTCKSPNQGDSIHLPFPSAQARMSYWHDFSQRRLGRSSNLSEPAKGEKAAVKGLGTKLSLRGAQSRTIDIEKLDPDLETVGLVLEGIRLYVLGAIFVLATAVSPVLLQGALEALQVAGVQAFLHLLPTVIALWVVVDVGPLTPAALRGSAFAALTYGLQTLCTFGALLDGSALLYLTWRLLVPPVLALVVQQILLHRAPPILAVLGLVLGGSAPVVALGTRSWPALSSILFLLGWSAVEAIIQLREAIRIDPEPATAWMRGELAQQVKGLVAAEEEVDPGAHSFLTTALPAVPLLIVGFLMGDGPVLLDHELSVPAVTIILLSALAWAVATVTGLLLKEAMLSQRQHVVLALLAAVGSIATACLMRGVGKPGPLGAASLGILGGCAAQFFRFKR
eukprot:jgi/Botrbrau1/14992/Bobra.0018s0092.1